MFRDFLDLLLKSSRLLPHHAKDLPHITHFIQIPTQSKVTTLCILGKNQTSVQNAFMVSSEKKMQN